MVQEVTKALEKLFEQGYGYKKAGVLLYDIRPNQGVQSALFDAVDHAKHSSLMQTLDALNTQYGKSSVKMGADNSTRAKVNSEYLSPRYTTEWSDIITVKV